MFGNVLSLFPVVLSAIKQNRLENNNELLGMFNCSKGPFSLLKMHSVGELNFILQRPNFNLVPRLIFKAQGLNYNVMKIKDHNIMTT